MTITDAFAAGDMFQLYDFGVAIGATTSVAAAGPVTDISDPVVALGDLDLSHGFFSLGPGAHSLDIQVIQNATASPKRRGGLLPGGSVPSRTSSPVCLIIRHLPAGSRRLAPVSQK